MKTAELLTKVYSALSKDQKLTDNLAKGSQGIYHIQAPPGNEARIPYIVYSVVSDIPGICGDDYELGHYVTLRIHIVTGNTGGYWQLYEIINTIMVKLGFSRLQVNELKEDDGHALCVADYKIGVEA